MKRSLVWMAVLALIACGSAEDKPAAAPAPTPEPAKAEAPATAPAKPKPTPPTATSDETPQVEWKWTGEGEPSDFEATSAKCQEVTMKDPRGGPDSPVLVRLQIAVACMTEEGWEPRLQE